MPHEQARSMRSGSCNIETDQSETNIEKIKKLEKNDIIRKNSEPLKEIETSPVKKKKPLSVRHIINKIEKIEEKKKENTEESKKELPIEECLETVVKENISVIQETSEYEDTSKRVEETIVSSSCKSEIGYKIKDSDKLGDYNQLNNTVKSISTLAQGTLNINTMNSDREGENKVKVVNKLETPNKLSCYSRLFRCFKK